MILKLESFLVYFKTYSSTWVHHWLIKSESQRDAQQSLGCKCLLKFSQHYIVYWAYWSGLESTTLAFLRKDWQSYAHICNSALPISTIAPLCIFLEILEDSFYFVLDRLWHRSRIYCSLSRKCILCSIYCLVLVPEKSYTMSPNDSIKILQVF